VSGFGVTPVIEMINRTFDAHGDQSIRLNAPSGVTRFDR